MKNFIVVVLLFCFIFSCGKNNPLSADYNPCKDRMDKQKREWGVPDDISTFHASGYRSETWSYYNHQMIITWSWGKYILGCEKTTYTYKPALKITTENCERCQ